MGFSTSGAVAILLIAFFLAASAIVPTVFDISSQTGAAFSAQADQIRDQQQTAFDIESAERTDESGDGTADTLTITATNDGSITLDTDDTDVLVDGYYVSMQAATTEIEDESETRPDSRLWAPGTTLTIEIDEATLEDESGGHVTSVEDVERVSLTAQTGITVSTNDITGGS